jgi:hypothetical protein
MAGAATAAAVALPATVAADAAILAGRAIAAPSLPLGDVSFPELAQDLRRLARVASTRGRLIVPILTKSLAWSPRQLGFLLTMYPRAENPDTTDTRKLAGASLGNMTLSSAIRWTNRAAA